MAIAAKFRNNGQVCISPNRFYIHESKKDEFVNLFIDKTKKLKIGDGMDSTTQLGPLTTKKRLNEIEELVEKTKHCLKQNYLVMMKIEQSLSPMDH